MGPASILHGQEVGVVMGRVTDASGVQPVAAADVFVRGTSLVSLTDQNGTFRLDGVPAGATEIQVECPGYVSATRSVEVLAGAVATADFNLDVSAVALDAVVVTATGPQRRRGGGETLPQPFSRCACGLVDALS